MKMIINITYIDTPKQRFIAMSEHAGYKLYPVTKTVEM